MSSGQSADSAANQRALRQAFSLFPTGVIGVCALDYDQPIRLVMTSFTTVSLDPPLVSICIAHTSKTWPILAGKKRLGISVLGSEQEALARSLASPEKEDRFGSTPWQSTPSGAVLIDGGALWLECEIRATYEGGDHEIVLMETHESHLFPKVSPLIFHQSELRGLAMAT